MEREYVGIDLHRRRSVIVRKNSKARCCGRSTSTAASPSGGVATSGRVAAARKVLRLVFYGLRDGQIRCLTSAETG